MARLEMSLDEPAPLLAIRKVLGLGVSAPVPPRTLHFGPHTARFSISIGEVAS